MRSSLPRLITIFLAVGCFFTILDTLVGVEIDTTLDDETNYYHDMIRSIIAAAIWIPHFQMSSRVKETFVKRITDDDNSSYETEVATSQYQSFLLMIRNISLGIIYK